MTLIGVMQGRMVPPVDGRIQAFPRDRWADEFALAAASGLDSIEWIYDTYGEGVNPLASASGIARILSLARGHAVAVRSVCADYFMERPLIRVSEHQRTQALAKLDWLLGRCNELGVQRVVLPFVDNSAIRTPDEERAVVECLGRVLPAAERHGIELHLETSLDPQAFQRLMGNASHPLIKVNYDIGNSASLGYRPREELAAYGDRIGSVHVKDRVLGGSTVALGTGDADFAAVFAGLGERRYAGDIILQVARGVTGEEVAWAKGNRAFVDGWLSRGGDGPGPGG